MNPYLRRPPPKPSELHRTWLALVDTEGPFLSVPALLRVWPQGMPPLPDAAKSALVDTKPTFDAAWDRWDVDRDQDDALPEYRSARDAWVDVVLRDILGWREMYSATPPVDVAVSSPDRSVSVTPTGALTRDGTVGALTLVVDPVDALGDPLTDGWAASPLDRMEELLRHAGVPVGVVTDGRWWAIVSARPQTMVASGVVDAQTWVEEQSVTAAFVELLARRRLVGTVTTDQLTEMFRQSVAAAEEITEALGVQVRRAVELLVQAFSDAAVEARRAGHPDPLPARRHDVYEAAVTVMMRAVFLLFAEERGLLPQGQLFTAGYGISDELDRLDNRARDEGAESLDGAHLTWHRLLATTEALYRGASFEDLRLPAYGGSLFDPARFEFLTARTELSTLAVVVSDRVMLEVLSALQVAHLRGEPARRISFRDIDVEQIGYIYEGLLGYSCSEVVEVTVGLIGKAGAEPEIPLGQLEDLSESYVDDPSFAEALRAWSKEHQPAAECASKAALVKAIRSSDAVTDADRALRAVTPVQELRERLKPFIGLIRRDLRDRPMVVVPGGLVVVETPSRASAGAHYTPRSLAEEVVEHALAPLVFQPGPHQTADQDAWVLIESERILELNVADIACGSGAFLVAAARYLAARLIEAWHREGVAVGTAHELQISAIRKVVASCLYGADINGMAVEMCKLSLWLVSLDAKLPFSFVDDKVLHGNSLLGVTDVRQLKAMHIDPPTRPADPTFFELDIDGVLDRAITLRRSLATEVDDHDPQRSATTKRRQWDDYQHLTAQLSTVADGIIAAGLGVGGKPGRKRDNAYEDLRHAINLAYGPDENPTALGELIDSGLAPTVPTDYVRWQPLHWVLAVPDVIAVRGGFDAIVGNPPFLGGQKLTGALGTEVRDWFVHALAGGRRGSADLVAYFFLRAASLLNPRGTLGLIATNTVAQGDTREVGLDRMAAAGLTITRAIQSRSWPAAGVNLEYAAVWGTGAAVDAAIERICDDVPVAHISTLLEPAGRVDGHPIRLVENTKIGFIGCYVLGMGFVLEPEEAADWIDADPTNAEVLFPYLNGEDLNSRPDTSPSRWVVDFNNRSEEEAAEYGLPFERLEQKVKAERSVKPKAVSVAPWWLFLRARPGLRKAISGLDEVLVIALVSKTVMPARVRTGQIFSHKLGVIANTSYAGQGAMSSSLHQMWATRYGSTMRTDVNYSPSDVFETFPRPRTTDSLDEMGKTLDVERREIMLRRQLGLTSLYNLVNDPDITNSADPDVARMREIHVELDRAVMSAYGWDDVPLQHGFHTYRQMRRWTVSPAARVEILDRLLEENHRRAAQQGNALSELTDDGDDLELDA